MPVVALGKGDPGIPLKPIRFVLALHELHEHHDLQPTAHSLGTDLETAASNMGRTDSGLHVDHVR